MSITDAPLFQSIARRDFLRVSATALAGIAATNLIDPASLFAASSSLPLLSIGYAPSIPERGMHIELSAAANILSPDPTFIGRGARVAIAGYGRSARHENEPGGVQIDAIFPVLSRTPETYPHFHAWNTSGGTITFTMPVTATDGIGFLVHRMGGEKNSDPTKAPAPGLEQNRVQLGVNSGGDARLTRGAYVFAFREDGSDSAPNWSRLALLNTDGFLTVPAIGVSYAVVTINYATPDRTERDKPVI